MLIGGKVPSFPVTEYTEAVRDAAGGVTSVVTWLSSVRVTKVREDVVTRDADGRVVQIDRIRFSGGAEVERLRSTFAYNFDRVVSRAAVRILA